MYIACDYICDPILENQSLCHIEIHEITQSIVTSTKEVQNFQDISVLFLVI